MTNFLFMIIVGDGLQICMDLTNFNPRKFFVKFYILYCISEINFFVKLIFSRSFNIWRTKILFLFLRVNFPMYFLLTFLFWFDLSCIVFLVCKSCITLGECAEKCINSCHSIMPYALHAQKMPMIWIKFDDLEDYDMI